MMNIAFSPCPNDTYIFHAWVHGLIPNAPRLDVTFADINITNDLAVRREGPDVMKISYAVLPDVLSDYSLIPCGGALGHQCGPLVLVHPQSNAMQRPAHLSGRKIAVPSLRSTAYLLFQLWATRHVPGGLGEVIVMPFEKIMPAVFNGQVDAGLVIHEARFTYQAYGLSLVQDLGQWWESDTGLPIPLGAIIAKRHLNREAIAGWISASLAHAVANPEASQRYVMQHAQELDPEVARAHINLYVNEFSADLGKVGYAAVEALLLRAVAAGLVPHFDLSLLR